MRSPVVRAVRLGMLRGWAEFRQSLTSAEDIGYYVVTSLILLVVLILQRGGSVEGTTLSLATLSLPGILGMLVGFGGMVGAASGLALNKEDGTLLRAKAVPHGMVGYLTGSILNVALSTVISVVIIIVPGFFVVPGLTGVGIDGWLTMLWVLALGLLATVTWGAMLGSVVNSARTIFGWGMLGAAVLVGISGIFYPIQALWGWVQGVAQVFPIYWLGLGMRSAILPDTAVAVEIGQSWRTMQTVGVLGAWSVVGLLLAPGMLRRMARRQSGASVEANRLRALQRVG